MVDVTSLRITEIFYSLQGESSTVGYPTVFVRLTGCPLRCVYCDSAYAFKGGKRFTITEVLSEVALYQPKYVTVTGGEPLAQPACIELLKQLCDAGYFVSIETSGALDIGPIDQRVMTVMDWKTPESGEMHRNRQENVKYLKSMDQVKYVISSREDYEWSKSSMIEHGFVDRCDVLFSPVYEKLQPKYLADWIVEDRIPVRFQFQLHKLLWNDEPGR